MRLHAPNNKHDSQTNAQTPALARPRHVNHVTMIKTNIPDEDLESELDLSNLDLGIAQAETIKDEKAIREEIGDVNTKLTSIDRRLSNIETGKIKQIIELKFSDEVTQLKGAFKKDLNDAGKEAVGDFKQSIKPILANVTSNLNRIPLPPSVFWGLISILVTFIIGFVIIAGINFYELHNTAIWYALGVMLFLSLSTIWSMIHYHFKKTK